MTFEMKLKDAFKEGEGEVIHILLSEGRSVEEVAQMLKMTVDEAQDCVNRYLEYLKETPNTETEPNKITYAAMVEAENDKDMYGSFDSVTELMKVLNA